MCAYRRFLLRHVLLHKSFCLLNKCVFALHHRCKVLPTTEVCMDCQMSLDYVEQAKTCVNAFLVHFRSLSPFDRLSITRRDDEQWQANSTQTGHPSYGA
jgi:hypothetical protein